jgi:hypothetical protein
MIEILTLSNLIEALDFAERSHQDSAWKDYPFDRELLCKNLEKMIRSPQHFTCIYRSEGKIIGYWFATLCRLLCSKKLRGEENGIYILPEHRGGRSAYIMWMAYKQWCFEHDAEPICQVQFSDDQSNQKAYSFFRKAGMIECGRIFRGGNHGMRKSS